jgi:hypothetical protein
VDGPEVGGGAPRLLCMLNQTTARAALAAFNGLLGAHTTSVRQLDTGLRHPCIECIDNHELTELSNYRD